MDREQFIYNLEEAISEYKEEKENLDKMIYLWEIHEDPGSDPGEQYSQAHLVNKKFKNIIEVLKSQYENKNIN